MLRLTAPLAIALALIGCGSDNKYDQGLDPVDTASDLPDDGGTDGGHGGPGGPGGGGGDTGTIGGSTDGGTTDGGSTDGGTTGGGTTTPEGICNPWDPMDAAGASKIFDVTADGATGTEEISVIGDATSPVTGQSTFKYIAQLGPLSDGREYSGSVYVSCEADGMYMVEWSQIYTDSSGSYTVSGVDSPGRKYLPDPATLGYVGSWNYSYTMDITVDYSGKPYSLPMRVDGTYSELGFEEIEVSGVSYEAYKLHNAYTIAFDGLSGYGAFTRSGDIYLYYVEGLGQVYEEHTYEFDNEPGVIHNVVKEMSSSTGF